MKFFLILFFVGGGGGRRDMEELAILLIGINRGKGLHFIAGYVGGSELVSRESWDIG